VKKFPGVRMPGLGVAEADATDLIAYLRAETSRLNEAQAEAAPERPAHQHHHDH
jgi:hypothetical protein